MHDSMSDSDSTRSTFPIQMRAVNEVERKDTLLNILRTQRLLDQSVLEEHPPFFWGGVISNTKLDSHFTHMMLSSLRNYAAEAAIGVAFLPGHDHYHLPIGSSLTGELSEGGNEASVRADFYTLTGLQIGSVRTSDFAAGIKGALTRDMSIGLFGGNWICDICGQDYFRGRCPHLAGFTYEEEKNGVIRQMLATVGIDDAHLSEVSGVFDGSTPGAMIEKAYEMARSGALSLDDVRHAETVYRMDKEATQRMLALPALQKKHTGVEIPGQTPGKVDEMGDEEVKRVQVVFARVGVSTTDDLADSVEAMGTKLDAVSARVKELEPQAADGRQYRADLISEALAEGVRAQGKDFDQPTYEGMLTSAPIATIKRMRDDWQRIGNERLPGGRKSVDEDQREKTQAQTVQLVPDRAFAG